MGLFRSKNKEEDDTPGHVRKQSTYDVHDPVLTAIRDEEPFQMSANTAHAADSSISPDMTTRDVFGNPIERPDRSNPSRPRDQRPLDTIRAFEYACTGDERLRDEMETARYGWATRPTFVPRFETNPYAAASSSSPNVVTFNSEGGAAAQEQFKTYTPPKPEKKKRGFFGRKKKE